MSFGSRLQEARKKKGLSQGDVAKELGTKGPVIGRYERDDMKPSIETAAKLAELLDVSLDYLVGTMDIELDPKMINRVAELQLLAPEDQERIFYIWDMAIRDAKARRTYAS